MALFQAGMAVGIARNTRENENRRLTERECEKSFEMELHSLRPGFLLNWPNVDALLTNWTLTVDTYCPACGSSSAMTKVCASTNLVPEAAL